MSSTKCMFRLMFDCFGRAKAENHVKAAPEGALQKSLDKIAASLQQETSVTSVPAGTKGAALGHCSLFVCSLVTSVPAGMKGVALCHCLLFACKRGLCGSQDTHQQSAQDTPPPPRLGLCDSCFLIVCVVNALLALLSPIPVFEPTKPCLSSVCHTTHFHFFGINVTLLIISMLLSLVSSLPNLLLSLLSTLTSLVLSLSVKVILFYVIIIDIVIVCF